MHTQPLSIYLHIPFCTTKCTYCAFNTYTNLQKLIPAFVQALCQEIKIVSVSNPHTYIHSIYFGGGTPTLLDVEQFNTILNMLHQCFTFTCNAEISIEANPNDLNEVYLANLRAIGVNRLSIGMQSANNNELKFFDRRHDSHAVVSAVQTARKAGFNNLSLDLIYGFPHQNLQSWQFSLEQALSLNPEHLSLYALGVEDGTPMAHWVEKGSVIVPEDDFIADMYDIATTLLQQQGYDQYEISNWAKPGYECLHNLQYWRNEPYLGLGPGAHGYAANIRYDTLLSPQRYIKVMSSNRTSSMAFPLTPATNNAIQVEREDMIAETLITNLRLLHEGVSRARFLDQFGIDLIELHGKILNRFATFGLIEISKDKVRITQKGRLLSSMIFRELI